MGDRFIDGFYNFLRPTLGLWLTRTYNIKGDNSRIKDLKPPYLVISNHCLNWDPFIVSKYIPKAVRYIASDNLFRSRFLAFLLTHFVGAVSKTKAMADSKTVKETIKILKRGGVIGVFPEANRTWDGRNIDIIYSTAKLVKLTKVPVVMCVIRGGYLSRPRWAVKGRKGVIDLLYYPLFDSESIKGMSVDEIYDKMNKAVYYDEYEWQRENMQYFKSDTTAEYLELFLYICPKCKSIGSLYSIKDKFICKECGLTHTMDNYGFFTGSDRMYETPAEWGKWQFSHLKSIVEEKDLIFEDKDAILYGKTNKNKIYEHSKGSLALYKDRIEYLSQKGEKLDFHIEKITGNTIQLNYIFEFYYEGIFRRFIFNPKSRISAFKWNQAVDYIKKRGINNNETRLDTDN